MLSVWLVCKLAAPETSACSSNASTPAWMSPSASATALSSTDMGSPRQLCHMHKSFDEHLYTKQGHTDASHVPAVTDVLGLAMHSNS